MSTRHPVWFVPVRDTEARIGLTPCPGTKEASLSESLSTLKQWGASAILTLMPSQEMADNQVAIHCKGGSGRTGLVAAQIMLEQGMGLEESIRLIKAQRPGAFGAPAQQKYIQQVAEKLG